MSYIGNFEEPILEKGLATGRQRQLKIRNLFNYIESVTLSNSIIYHQVYCKNKYVKV